MGGLRRCQYPLGERGQPERRHFSDPSYPALRPTKSDTGAGWEPRMLGSAQKSRAEAAFRDPMITTLFARGKTDGRYGTFAVVL